MDCLDCHLKGDVVAVAVVVAVVDEDEHDGPFVVAVNDADLIDEFADSFDDGRVVAVFVDDETDGDDDECCLN